MRQKIKVSNPTHFLLFRRELPSVDSEIADSRWVVNEKLLLNLHVKVIRSTYGVCSTCPATHALRLMFSGDYCFWSDCFQYAFFLELLSLRMFRWGFWNFGCFKMASLFGMVLWRVTLIFKSFNISKTKNDIAVFYCPGALQKYLWFVTLIVVGK
jgi:hypothetical protein